MSFFGPFYGGYGVLATDYELSLVSSYNLSTSGSLAPSPQRWGPGRSRPRGLGFATDRLIWVSQDPAGNAHEDLPGHPGDIPLVTPVR